MNNSSPTSPLALANSPNGSPNHNDNVPIIAHTTQPRELPLLDGIPPHYHCQPNSARTSPYANALKYGMGRTGSSQIPPPENFVLKFQEKRFRPTLGPRTTKYFGLKPQDSPIMDNRPSIALVEVHTEGSKMAAQGHFDPTGIMLAKSSDMKAQGEESRNTDSLNAMEDDEEEGMDTYENAE
ncbi:hypothetical protein Cgig2_014176 [Carnegiea gigantea]|uniref:Uncharacterized protein n=1 Tax=Carnegiea gigantea TaxID=171969 RepID=A0A9Q1K823_9CARY|nr:hypothetical protein Cgig2_014176 [Carnegiea gigantea]